MNNNVCCFFGHRTIEITDNLKLKLHGIIKKLIIAKNVDTFLFGSRSQFNDLCYQITTELKTTYTQIKRVYIRAEFPYINESYKKYLLQSYEDTYFPDNILKAGKASYIERNHEMINKSKFCVVYYNQSYTPYKNSAFANTCKSGTKIAYDFAIKKERIVINMFEEKNRLDNLGLL